MSQTQITGNGFRQRWYQILDRQNGGTICSLYQRMIAALNGYGINQKAELPTANLKAYTDSFKRIFCERNQNQIASR